MVMQSENQPPAQFMEHDSPVCSNVTSDVLSLVWGLCIAPVDGWEPQWVVPLSIMVAVCALLVAGAGRGAVVAVPLYMGRWRGASNVWACRKTGCA